jgi:predicted Zn-dependent protease
MGASGQPFTPEADERTLWERAEKEEAVLAAKGARYDDPVLEQYLVAVADRLLSSEVRATGGPGVNVTILRDATLNAFAMPDGRLYVHTGLLSRLENEAQLAAILAREVTHVTRRDGLQAVREAATPPAAEGLRSAAISIGAASARSSRTEPGDPGAAALGRTASVILGQGLWLTALACIQGYGSDLEAAADRGSLEALRRAGYDPREAPRALARLQGDLNERGALETFLLGRQSQLQERIDVTKRLIERNQPAPVTPTAPPADTDDFRRRMRAVVRENAALDVRAGRFALAQDQLERVLAITPDDPLAHLYYGDLHRLAAQRARSDAERETLARMARERYISAAELDPTSAEPVRQLGLLAYQNKDFEGARAAFRTYLTLQPDAPDAGRIREYLHELER